MVQQLIHRSPYGCSPKAPARPNPNLHYCPSRKAPSTSPFKLRSRSYLSCVKTIIGYLMVGRGWRRVL
jgi:hypothetical protein